LLVARLGALDRVAVAADLDIELLYPGAEVRFEQVVENLRALRLDVIVEQHRRSAAAHGADSFVLFSRVRAVDGDGLRGIRVQAEEDREADGEPTEKREP
jgi:hypothetical protein